MGYEDRDYFKSKPGVELSFGLPRGTMILLIIVGCAFLACMVLANATDLYPLGATMGAAMPSSDGQPGLVYSLFVLQPPDVAVWLDGSRSPQPWKLLTHWMLSPSLISMVLALVGIYIVGKLVEQFLGMRRFLGLFVASSVIGAIGACIVDSYLSKRPVMIVGADAGIMATLITLLWLAPNERTFLNMRVKTFVLLLVAIGVLARLFGFVNTSQPAVISPTHEVFAMGVAAAYMSWLKRRGALPQLASLVRSGVNQSGMEPDADPLERRMRESLRDSDAELREERKRREAAERERARIDELLEKISKNGVNSLSRADRKFLDEHSKKKK